MALFAVCIQNRINLENIFFFTVWDGKGVQIHLIYSWEQRLLFAVLHRANLLMRKICDQTSLIQNDILKVAQKAEAIQHFTPFNIIMLLALSLCFHLLTYDININDDQCVSFYSFLFEILLSELYPWLCSKFCFGSARKSSIYVFKWYEPSWCMCCA